KMTLAALEATLRIYLNEEIALREIPVLHLLGLPLDDLKRRAEDLASQLQEIDTLALVAVAEDVAYVGGGSLPDQPMKTWVVELDARGMSDEDLGHRLRVGTPAVLGRLREGHLALDVRTILPHQEPELAAAVRRAVGDRASERP